MRNRKPSQKLTAAKNMPPLYHTLPGEDFRPEASQVLEWASRQTDLLLWIFDTITSAKLIKYNPDTVKWQGIEYQESCPYGYNDWDDCPDCRH